MASGPQKRKAARFSRRHLGRNSRVPGGARRLVLRECLKGCTLESDGIMQTTEMEVALLQPGEKVIGTAYLTPDGEIVFSPHPGALEVVLVEPQGESSGPWVIRRRPSTFPH